MGKLGKHDHKLTNLLKAGIFSLIMLAPLISIGVRCLYVINNKNAYESYNGQIESSETQNLIEYLNGNTITTNNYKTGFSYYENDKLNRYFYTLKFTGNYTATEYIFNVNNFKLNGIEDNTIKAISISYGNTTTLYLNTFTINWTEETNRQTVYRWEINGNTYTSTHLNLNLNNNPIEFIITNSRIYSNNNSFELQQMRNLSNLLTTINYYSGTLDNVFYYSIQDLEQQSTFNWVQNTAIYTPLNAMCSGLGITESAIPILLTYWALMTLIYIVFDIIIYLFTKMTHFLGTN